MKDYFSHVPSGRDIGNPARSLDVSDMEEDDLQHRFATHIGLRWSADEEADIGEIDPHVGRLLMALQVNPRQLLRPGGRSRSCCGGAG
ncbi:hypothetical protein [Mesorhizobium sp. LNHC229A00]|uniref:hypothetical protein n=1 Tax=Mesorhizobium sp. LNHC229A00 TaxID=1287240 RepID=UPI0018DE98C1|nr:hypothetical protein [Mesorhizobium sp. LNHC229A00]